MTFRAIGPFPPIPPFAFGVRTLSTSRNGSKPGAAAPPDAFGVERCRQEIESGKYHAIVVVDYSNDDLYEQFEQDLGDLLREFVAAGGVCAFPSSEGLLVSTLQKLFDVTWRVSGYYRTTFGPCKENELAINYSFGNGDLSRAIIKDYSAKGVTLRGVPPHERCFGVTSESRTQSVVPDAAGKGVSGKSDDGEYDIIFAMNNYGKGTIAYFGDVHGENETLWLVSSFVESRAPRLPIDNLASIEETAFDAGRKLKEEGNEAFQHGKFDEVEAFYKAAIEKFGAKLGSNGLQRDGLVSILSNLALIHWKKKEYLQAESVATKALDIQWDHGKCSYRRAMARYQIHLSTSGGDIKRLREAMKDVVNADPSDATRTLLNKIEKEIARAELKQRGAFSSEFASAISGTLK